MPSPSSPSPVRELPCRRLDAAGVEELAASSRSALDRDLAADAELTLAVPRDEAVVAGAFDLVAPGPRRGSGGAPARVGPGTVWLQLALARPDALVACDPARLLNRYVRPLLRVLTRCGAHAHYFGRDWVSGPKRPVALVSFGHDATTGRALVEAVVAVTTPFSEARASFLGHAPATLAELAPRRPSPAHVADALADAYASAYGRVTVEAPAPSFARARAERDAPRVASWGATVEEAIGLVGAARDDRGRLRVGGDFMASRDALAALEAALAALDAEGRAVEPTAVGDAVDAALGAPGVALFGVQRLASLRDVVLRVAGLP